MRDDEILGQIRQLVDEQHRLRASLAAGELTSEEEQSRIRLVERSLDRCWDLLRQRRARRDVGDDPDHTAPRPAGEIEDYEY
ncbi:DUF2630 family protein [Sphaerimonospora sp. CA-214678]|uniref:DUF2630 family protein n=1 Tax=Sphaerimonospora sp. CA-214678 TaxID=3240029 RepID=UPI003D8CA1AB